MNISKTIDHAADSLEKVDWNTVAKELIELWDLIWKIFVISAIRTYVAGETLGLWVHRTNDFLAHHWVRLIVPPTPAEGQAPIIFVEEVSAPTPPTIEVEPQLPTVKAEVVEIPEPQEQPPSPARRRRNRNSALNSLEETVTKEIEPPPTRRTRGRRAHKNRARQTA